MYKTKISLFKSLYKSKDVPYLLDLEQVFKRIKEGKSKAIIEQMQTDPTAKNKLPCIMFSGEFIERKKTGLKQHSGLMVLDFDKVPETDYNRLFNQLKQNKHIIALFRSPSRNGIKGVVRIPECDAKNHEKYFKEFVKDYHYDYIDISGCNVDRVCFESYDPHIYINYKGAEYSPKLTEDGFKVVEKTPMLPIQDDAKKIDIIMAWNWNKGFKEGERNNFILDIAGAFCEYGVNESSALSYILNNVVIGDFSEDEARQTIKSAYRLRSFGIKYFEDYTRIDKIKKDLKYTKEKVMEIHQINGEVYEQVTNDTEHHDFWFFDNDKVKLIPLKYKQFLERNGFKKFFPGDSLKPSFVKVQSNIVQETSTEIIKDFVLNYLLDINEEKVWSYCANYQMMFSDNYLQFLDNIELIMLKDTREKSFIAYENGILEVTKESVVLNDYTDCDGYIWKNQIIKREFTPSKNIANDYKVFIHNISNGEPLAIECTIGYLLYTYKNKVNNKAIILNDEVISDNPEGGTGKGLFVQGLREIRRTGILDGKSFDDKKSFAYQTISQDTQILVFDDVKKNFDFESKFSLVTEGITLERKNKDAIKLSVEDSPKMVLSTNYAIKGEGNSHNRRRHEIEFAQYYNHSKTPYDDFKRQLFDDWDDKDYVAFDNYMVYCIQQYFIYGLIEQKNAKNIKVRRFIAETSMEFYEWITDKDTNVTGVRLNKRNFYDQFVEDYQDYKKWLTQKKFNIWIQKYARFANFGYSDGNTNGSRWFELTEEIPF